MSNILRSKSNETKKFGQLIEYNMKNIFLEKSYAKCVRETSPRNFFGKLKWAYHWYTVCFCCISGWGLSKYIETKL